MRLKKEMTKITVFQKKKKKKIEREREKHISNKREKLEVYILFKFGHDFVIVFIVVFAFQYT